MKNLLIITQKVDETDDLLGFFPGWINVFAKSYAHVDVVAQSVGPAMLASNVHVHSLGKERGASKIEQAKQFARLLWRHTPKHGAVFAHMSPIFAIAAWPFACLRRSRLALWYLHRSNTLRLRVAVQLCDRVFTADTRSLTIENPKILAVGHGIDKKRFTVSDRQPPVDRPLHIITVGRLSPIKDLETFIRAMALVKRPVEVRIVGRAVMAGDEQYAKSLHALVAELGLEALVQFVGFVPYRDIAPQYAWADVAIGCTPTGGLDKSLLEAMASGCVVFTSNRAMEGYLPTEQLFEHSNAQELADRIENLADFTPTNMDFFALNTTITNIVRAL